MVKQLFLWLHKWLGLTTGLIVVLVSLSGCVYVFVDELKELCYKDRLFVTAETRSVLPLSTLKDRAQEALGAHRPITRCEVYPQAGRTWVFRAVKTDPEAIGHWRYYIYYDRVYINPYNGKIVYIEDSKNEFFQLIVNLHMNLLLGDRIGSPLVDYGVLVFLLILISGAVLWWPQKWNRKQVKKHFKIKWGASFKRLNHDLHNVLGFYILLPIFVIAVTGLVFSFSWVDQSVQYVFNGGHAAVKRSIPQSAVAKDGGKHALDQALLTVLHEHPTAALLSIRFRGGETTPIDIQTRLQEGKSSVFEWYYFDQKNGDLLMKYGNQTIHGGEQIRAMNYDLHVGSIGGLGTQLLAFIASLICASLPITGFFIWYHKNRKKKTPKKQRKERSFVYEPGKSITRSLDARPR